METRALVLAVALIAPLALYGIPFAYAATSTSSYVKTSGQCIAHPSPFPSGCTVQCNSGDYVTGAGYNIGPVTGGIEVVGINGLFSNGATVLSGTPTGVGLLVMNPTANDESWDVLAFCQTPVTVAGIGVPQFGSLYVAIALGAVVYFLLAKRLAPAKTSLPHSS